MQANEPPASSRSIVFDLRAQQWRRREVKGNMIVVRYADDLVVGFELEAEARRLWDAMRTRFEQFSLELHGEKTRLLVFGRYAIERRQRKPQTFNFLESHLEARLWNDVFVMTQEKLGIPQGTIKATVLIETILAAFEMDEILYELREHSAGLNAGRWDYIFSCIKKFKNDRDFCLADRARVTMRAPFMRAYALLLLKTCHRRGAPAIGGMSALIPIKNDPEKNAIAMDGNIRDKRRDATDGY